MNLDLIKALKNIAKEVPSWAGFTSNDVNVIRSIGASNHTYIIESNSKDTEPFAIIYRIFGKVIEEYFTDREFENLVYSRLGDYSLGPSIYHSHEVFRMEEYFNSNVLPYEKMLQPYYLFQVMRALALLHSVKVEFPALKEPRIQSFIKDEVFMAIVRGRVEEAKKGIHSDLQWEKVEYWLSSEGTQYFQNLIDQLPNEKILSHNDLNSNNILICKDNDHFKIIDFEYADFSWRAIDLGNYLIETHFDYSYKEPPFYVMKNPGVPNSKVTNMLAYYLIFSRIAGNSETKYWKETQAILENFQKHDFSEIKLIELIKDYQIDSEEIEKFKTEVIIGMSLNNYYWLLWSLYIGIDSNQNFDYIFHAWKRCEFLDFLKSSSSLIFTQD